MDDIKASLTISKVNDLLEDLDISIIKNRNITVDYLGSKCFHLNPYGISRSVSCIDLLLKSSKNNFNEILVLESDLSHFHKHVASVLKSYFKKDEDPNLIMFRDYKYFGNEKFSNEQDK